MLVILFRKYKDTETYLSFMGEFQQRPSLDSYKKSALFSGYYYCFGPEKELTARQPVVPRKYNIVL